VASAAAAPANVQRAPSELARSWHRFKSNRLSLAGAVVLLLIALGAIVGPPLARHFLGLTPYDLSCTSFAPMSRDHPLGCDPLGRDLLARLLAGGRVSLIVGLSVAIGSTGIGLIIGAIAGYFGGAVDSLLMRFTDTMLALPTFFILLSAAAVLGPSLVNTVIIISVLEWTTTARLVRGEFLVIREKEFVTAARAVGLTNLRIVRHILLNVVPVLVVAGTLAVASGILVESALSFLGLGTQPPQASWGYMLSSVQNFVFTEPLLGVFPGLLIMITVLAVNFVGEGLRDALDPRLVRR